MTKNKIFNYVFAFNLLCIWGLLAFGIYWLFFQKNENNLPQYQFDTLQTIHVQPLHLPDTIAFCGEIVPLNDPEVRERLDRELTVNAYMQASMSLIMKRANRWFPQMSEILKKEGIPDDFKYLCAIESGLENLVSSKKATGYWQILEPTGRELGLRITPDYDERYDPILATHAATKYLKKSKEKLGSWTLVAASYNMGISGVMRSSAQQFSDSYYDLWLNTETARYIYRILAFKIIMENPEKFNYKIPKEQLYQAWETDKVRLDSAVENLPKLALQLGISYKLFKYYNPALRTHKLRTAKGDSIFINLPKKSFRHGSQAEKKFTPEMLTEVFGWSEAEDSTNEKIKDDAK